MKRREKGEGSLYRRKNAEGKVTGWFGAYTVRTEYGKKRKTVYAKTKREAKVLLAKAVADAEAGLYRDEDGRSVGEYLLSWLEEAEGSLKASSYRRYEHSVRYHLSPAIGEVRLTRLTPGHVQRLYRRKLDEGLSPRSVIHLHEALRRAMNRAVRLGLIPRNPCDAVEPPRAPKSAMRPLDREQSARFLRAVRRDRFEALFILAITTGMRQGEILGLRWSDIDVEAARLRVCRSFVAWSGRGRGPTFTEPKSAGSRRVVSLTPLAVSALLEHKEKMKEDGLYSSDGAIFATSTGIPVLPSGLTRYHFKPILKEAGLPDIRFHDLRHTAATLLLGESVHPKIVQELLGHASIQLTLDTYSHYMPDMQDKAVDAMTRALTMTSDDTGQEDTLV